MKNNKKGFTLIELLVVVLIIGVLAAMALPAYFRAVERSRMSEAELIMGNVIQAQQRYKLRRGQGYTSNWIALDTAPAGVADGKGMVTYDTFCTKPVTDGSVANGVGSGAVCGNGFEIKLTGTADTTSTHASKGISSNDTHAGVIATRKNNDQYGQYQLFRFYDDQSHHTYCDATGAGDSSNAKAEALCIEFTNDDVYVPPVCKPGTAKGYDECARGDNSTSGSASGSGGAGN